MRTFAAAALARAVAELGDAVVDPAAWMQEMEKISAAVNAEGAALLGLAERPADIPRTPSVDEGFRSYFDRGFHLNGLREVRGMPLLLSGERVVIDEDIATPEEVRSTEYYNWLRSVGVEWFAAVALRADSDPWLLAIQRTPQQGPFEPGDKRALELLSPYLTEAATLSKAVGQVALASTASALGAVRHAAVALGRGGRVLDANAAAQALFDKTIYVQDGRFRVADPRARQQLDAAIEAMQAAPDAPLSPDPIVIARGEERPVVARFLSVPPAARSPFLGARALLTLAPVEPRPGPSAAMLARVFGLTPAEARLTSILAEGASLEQAAEELRIGRETARTQLKAVFAKTGTHRQGELVAVLAAVAL
jgi:DNA-binding CsgD family transcriptional regulator